MSDNNSPAMGTDTPVRILLVEDEPISATQVTLTLQRVSGGRMAVEAVRTLGAARARLGAGIVDVVLLDLNLPDSEGLATVSAIIAVAPDVPIVVMTATQDEALGLKAMELGAQDYLIKGDEKGRHVLRALTYAVERQRQKIALRNSEQRFRDFAEGGADWFWEMGPNLRFTWLSERFSQVAGIDMGNIIGRTRAEFMGAEDTDKIHDHLETLRRHKPFRDFTYRFSVGETERFFRVSGTPITSIDGEFAGYRGIGSDVTAEIEAQRFAIRMLAILMDAVGALPGGFMVFDADDRLLVANENVSALLPVAASCLVPGTPFIDILRSAAETGCFAMTGDIEDWLAEWRTIKIRAQGPVIEVTTEGTPIYFQQYPTQSGGMVRIVRLERGAMTLPHGHRP